MALKLKVCGMKYQDNILEVAALQPDYLGFIFYDASARNFEGIIPDLPKNSKKTGVFVNELLEIVVSLAQEYRLEALQLHGDESVAYIQEIKNHLPTVEIIKVFGVQEQFDFSSMEAYTTAVDYFLFDTKGKHRGGNGVKFDWTVLRDYPYTTPFFLSGGIGPHDGEAIRQIVQSGLPIYGVDINSKFESAPGKKNSSEVARFKNKLT